MRVRSGLPCVRLVLLRRRRLFVGRLGVVLVLFLRRLLCVEVVGGGRCMLLVGMGLVLLRLRLRLRLRRVMVVRRKVGIFIYFIFLEVREMMGVM